MGNIRLRLKRVAMATLSPVSVKIASDKSQKDIKALRIDRFGFAILQNGKKHSVSFIDEVTCSPIANIFEVESYQLYNSTFTSQMEFEKQIREAEMAKKEVMLPKKAERPKNESCSCRIF